MNEVLELELRQLPGVQFVAFASRGEMAVVEVGLGPDSDPAPVRADASVLATRHLIGRVRVDVFVQPAVSAAPSAAAAPIEAGPVAQPAVSEPASGNSSAAPAIGPDYSRDGRVRLVMARSTSLGAAYELHLSYREQTTVATAPAGDLTQVVTATLDGIERLGLPTPYDPVSVKKLDGDVGFGNIVVLRDRASGERRRGVATALVPEESTARAVLNALNRYLQPRSRHVAALGDA